MKSFRSFLEEETLVVRKGNKVLGTMPVEKSEMKDSIEAAKNAWPDADTIEIQSKNKTIKTVKVK